VIVAGPSDAPAIVFIHGTRLTGAMWSPQVAALSDTFRTIAVDLPAHGTHASETFTIENAVESLESDVLNGLTRYHEMTAVLDKISAGELLARRQDMLSNQLLSHALEQMLARGKRLRDTEAATINMQLVTWRDARAVNEAFVAGTGDALRTWRQP
jgi:pimeloyl-ACP methyl ester carboxylesterase